VCVCLRACVCVSVWLCVFSVCECFGGLVYLVCEFCVCVCDFVCVVYVLCV